ncbi:hypothetical protein CSZ94_17100 [Janthinobacterium sp. ROICE36]|uniref:Uncharacterized protein n=1 Tax=Janthinobacterium svalbardensis TaxID=368607 RepID=A0A290X057_9BURK|nr:MULTISPECIES: hypothetical protein [Janthinobacterium]ATD62490.1 hypothetical protein CNX70_21830 [Janthinobacterium svalbardensis]PLY41147.1 hypothetical protein CSZ94_17100 [Janthinobacterium sp. ROICE36]
MTIISIIQAAVWLYVLYLCVVILNKMDGETAMISRVGNVVLACGSACGIMSAISDREIFELMIAAGVAVNMTLNRRGAK